MRVRATMLGLVLLGGLVGGVPPAKAATVGVLEFQGALLVGAGVAYPCLDPAGGVAPVPTPPPLNLDKCPAVGMAFNAAPVVLAAGGTGTLASASTAKCPLPCAEAGTFAMGGAGAMVGWCGLSAGTLAGVIAPAVAVGTKAKARPYVMTWVETAGVLVFTGVTAKGETVVGTAVVAPLVGTCVDKFAKVFVVVGTIQLALV